MEWWNVALTLRSTIPIIHHSTIPSSSLEQMFGFLEKALADLAFLAVAKIGELLELGFLGRGHIGRHLDVDPHVQVPVAVTLNILNAFAF